MKKVIATRDPYETMVYTQDKYEGDIPSLESLAFKSIEINHLEIGSLSLSIIKPIVLRNMLWVHNDCIVKLRDIVGIRQGRFFGYTTDSKLVFLDSLVLVEKSSEEVKAAVLRLLCEEKELATGIESQCEEVNLLEYLTCPGYFNSFSQYVSLAELRRICKSNANEVVLEKINYLIELYEIYSPVGE